MTRTHAFASVAMLALVGSAASAAINPWDFNVFSRSTIGTAGSPYGSDYQGAAGSVGNAFFNGFSLRDIASSSPSLAQSFYGGGTFTLGGAVTNGGIEVAGNVTLNSASIAGTITSGGSLFGSGGGTVNGHVTLAGGNLAGPTLTLNGGLTTGAAFVPTVDVGGVSSFLLAQSNAAAALADNNTLVNINFGGEYLVNLNPGVNVVSIAASALGAANNYGFTVNGAGAPGATLIINVVGGGAATLDSTTWTYSNGASSLRTLLNYNGATSLALSGGNKVNFLAPNAAVHYSSGVVEGNLYAGSLTGSGQVNWIGGFEGTIPSPSAFIALGGGLVLAGRRRR